MHASNYRFKPTISPSGQHIDDEFNYLLRLNLAVGKRLPELLGDKIKIYSMKSPAKRVEFVSSGKSVAATTIASTYMIRSTSKIFEKQVEELSCSLTDKIKSLIVSDDCRGSVLIYHLIAALCDDYKREDFSSRFKTFSEEINVNLAP